MLLLFGDESMDIDAYDYFETESDIEIINKLREH